jgi:hypothetical protein
MSKGYLIFAKDSADKQYTREAYALALSIKAFNTDANVSIVTDNISDQYKEIFDNVIDIPWASNDTQTHFAAEHRWKLYHCTPYEETVVLDADMLVLNDISVYWETFKNYNVFYTSRVIDYRSNNISNDYYRKCFTANNLPNLYSAVHYFKKCDFSKQFYKLVEEINKNWELFYGKFVSVYYPKIPSMDVSAALAAKILDCQYTISSYSSPVTLTHMKPLIQGWQSFPLTWQEVVGSYFNDNCELKIGNFKQSDIFHYMEYDFLTDRIVKNLEKKVGI